MGHLNAGPVLRPSERVALLFPGPCSHLVSELPASLLILQEVRRGVYRLQEAADLRGERTGSGRIRHNHGAVRRRLRQAIGNDSLSAS